MRKSASTSHIHVDFNPKQMTVGTSAIDRLPIKRKASVPSLPRPQQSTTKENEAYQINLLKRVNESLERENQRLKKQLQHHIQQGMASRRSSIVGKKEEDYKQKLANRIHNKTKISTKTDHEETGVSNTKTNKLIQDIPELYEQYTSNRLIPSLHHIYEVAKEYFSEFKENFIKLKIMLDNAEGEEPKLKKKIEDLLYLFKVPILFKENPTLLAKSLSKAKEGEKSKERKGNECEPEMKSPAQILSMFQNLTKAICRSPKLLQKVRSSPYYLRMEKKMKCL